MSDTELIIFGIYIVGIIFNIIMLDYIFPEEKKEPSWVNLFLLPLYILQWLFEAVFVMFSWISWIVIFIISIYDKIKKLINKT